MTAPTPPDKELDKHQTEYLMKLRELEQTEAKRRAAIARETIRRVREALPEKLENLTTRKPGDKFFNDKWLEGYNFAITIANDALGKLEWEA